MKHTCFRLMGSLPQLAVTLGISLTGFLALTLPVQALELKVDQNGYHPLATKQALLEDIPEDSHFKILLVNTGGKKEKVVYEIKNVKEIRELHNQVEVAYQLLDFSDFKTPGDYKIKIEGTTVTSPPLKISEFIFWDLLKPVVRSFYLQRCGSDVEDATTKIVHEACHLKDSTLPNPIAPDYETDVTGGWHHNGSYDKDVVSTSLAAAKLLALYEWNPKPFQYLQLDYPYSEPEHKEMPDLLHEILFGLDWIKSMQAKDGQFFYQVADVAPLPLGKVFPNEDAQERILSAGSLDSTASAIACLAMATRDLRKKDLGQAIKTLMTAERGWRYLTANGNNAGNGSTSNINLLAYKVWAAAELYITTHKPEYQQYFLSHYRFVPVELYSRRNPALQGFTDYLFYAEGKDKDAEAYLQKKLTVLADGFKKEIAHQAYGTALTRFEENSNQEITEQISLLLHAYRLTSNEAYREAALQNLRYLLGINPQGKVFVTSIGKDAVSKPYHRLIQASGQMIPGLLVNGPNSHPKDSKTPAEMGALSYADDSSAFSSNQPSIELQGSLAFILSTFNALYNTQSIPEDKPESSLPEIKP